MACCFYSQPSIPIDSQSTLCTRPCEPPASDPLPVYALHSLSTLVSTPRLQLPRRRRAAAEPPRSNLAATAHEGAPRVRVPLEDLLHALLEVLRPLDAEAREVVRQLLG